MKRSALWRLTSVVIAGFALSILTAGAHALTEPRLKPPAPGPTYLSQNDRDRLLSIADSLKDKRFSFARAETALIADPVARSLGEWMYFMAKDPLVNTADAGAFLNAHRDWPALRRIQTFVEETIPNDAPKETVLAFFDSRDPVTGEGKVQLARALFGSGDQEAGALHLRDAWINHNFTLAEERRLLKLYGARLSREDHAARVDRLLWSRQVTNARRIFSRLAVADRRKAEARAALLLGAATAESLYERLSDDEQLEPGVLHAAVRYYRRKGEEQYALSLAAQAPQSPEALRNPARWWDERQLLMRWALREGRFSNAYRAAAEHGLAPGGDFAEAEFNAGWIALRFLDEPERAETHFLALASSVGTPISRSRAYYWLGRAAAAQGESANAVSYYEYAAQFYYSYYGQLAAEKLGGEALTQRFSAPVVSTPADRALFSSRPTVAALRMLSDLNLDYEFMVFAYHVDDQLERPGEYVELAKLTDGEGAPHLTVRAGKVAVRRNAFAPNVSYPLIFVPDAAARFVSPEIVLGLSRQESEFNPRAYSRAGARGVMQLIPSTAQITARKEGMRYSRSALLDDPVYNITLGSAHLSHLLDRYDGSLIMTLAAYNAGASRVTRWVGQYGDPRSAEIDPIDWVELIPFSETRNYVQRVLENVQVYRGRLAGAPIPGRLAADLERGGPRNRAAGGAAPSMVRAVAGPGVLPPAPQRTVEKAAQYSMLKQETSAPAREGAGADETQPSTAPMIEEAQSPRENEQSSRAPRTPLTLEPPAQQIGQPISAEDLAAAQPFQAQTVEAPTGTETAPALVATAATEPAGLPPVIDAQPPAAAPAIMSVTPAPTLTGAPEKESASMDACLAYRDFIARNAENEAKAIDLNASMLEELRGGGSACK